MAKKTKKEKTIELLGRKIARNDTLIENFIKYEISARKIERIDEKNVKYKKQKHDLENE